MPIERTAGRLRWLQRSEEERREEDSRKAKQAAKLGREAEARVQSHLESLGYYVMRSHHSLGCFDIIAFDEEDFFLIQVKSCAIAPTKERDRMWEVPAPVNARKLVWLDQWRRGRPERVWELSEGSLHRVNLF